MRVVFRADSSVESGIGHVMRCMALADEMASLRDAVEFICRDLDGNVAELIRSRDYRVHILPRGGTGFVTARDDARVTSDIVARRGEIPDWLIVDHYGIDARWETEVRPFARKIMVIDDLADREHVCDVLLDQNHNANGESRYSGLLSSKCVKLIGPRFALLRPEFREWRAKTGIRHELRRILVFFGGTDPSGETMKAIRALQQVPSEDSMVDIVVGRSNPRAAEIQAACRLSDRFEFHQQVGNMAELMSAADLSIGAGGTATWERCCLGLPSIVMSVAANQQDPLPLLHQEKRLYYLGRGIDSSADDIKWVVELFWRNPDLLSTFSRQAFSLVDGYGCRRVSQVLRKSSSCVALEGE